MTYTEIRDALRFVIDGDVSDEKEILETHSKDASLFSVTPKLVVFPKHTEDVKKVVKFICDNKKNVSDLSLTGRSAGTCMSGGPLNNSIIISFTRYMNVVGDANEEKKFITTQPGAFYRHFKKKTAEKGMFYPTFPASESICAMGGILGNNGGGEKSLKYGQAKDYVIEQNAIFSDGNMYHLSPLTKDELEEKIKQENFEGEVYKKLYTLIDKNYEVIQKARPKVSKNAAGYNLWDVWDKKTFDINKLIVGSQGTLCLTTEFTMKLLPIPKYARAVTLFLKDTKSLGDIVNDALSFSPESVEAYDKKTMQLALKFWYGFLMQRGLFGAIKLGISFIPELFYILRHGMPHLVLLVEFTGEDKKELEKRAHELGKKLSIRDLSFRYAFSKMSQEKFWSVRHDSFKLLRKHFKGLKTAPFIDDVIVPPETLPEFLPRIEKILDEYDFFYNIHGHAGNGNFHLIPLIHQEELISSNIIEEIAEKVYDIALEYGGSITAEHNDGIIRTPFLPKMYGNEVCALFQEVKNIFDPQNIFNPSKKVGGTKKNIREKLSKSV